MVTTTVFELQKAREISAAAGFQVMPLATAIDASTMLFAEMLPPSSSSRT